MNRDLQSCWQTQTSSEMLEGQAQWWSSLTSASASGITLIFFLFMHIDLLTWKMWFAGRVCIFLFFLPKTMVLIWRLLLSGCDIPDNSATGVKTNLNGFALYSLSLRCHGFTHINRIAKHLFDINWGKSTQSFLFPQKQHPPPQHTHAPKCLVGMWRR